MPLHAAEAQQMDAPPLYSPSDDKRPAIIGTCCTLVVLGNVCVAARCLTHLRSLNKIYVEDVFLLLAMVSLLYLLDFQNCLIKSFSRLVETLSSVTFLLVCHESFTKRLPSLLCQSLEPKVN